MQRIDFRTYPIQITEFFESNPEQRASVRDVFGFYVSAQPLSTYIHQLDEAGVNQAVLMGLDCTSQHGSTVASNEQIAALASRSDRIIGFASVDPSNTDSANELRRAVDNLGLAGLNLDPALQGFEMSDERKVFPVLEAAAAAGIPVSVQLGHHWAPKALTGHTRPVDLEPAIQSFPALPIVIPHCGWPFVDEALALAIKYPNVYLDTSVLYGARPESSVRRVLGEAFGLDVVEASLREKLLFASDYPRADPKRGVRAITQLGLRPLTEAKILGGNAARILNMEGTL